MALPRALGRMADEDGALQTPVPGKKASCWTPEEVRGGGCAAAAVCEFWAAGRAGRQPRLLPVRRVAVPPAVPRAQDDQLRAMVKQHGGRNWKKIAESLSNKTDVQCLHRWQKVGRRVMCWLC